MTVSLKSALGANQPLLGSNFEHLGRANWVYLSYDQQAGWSVVKFEGCLGFIQQILRIIGFYASTRLSVVAPQIQKEAAVPPALLAKINASWQRQGHPIPPPVPPAPIPERISVDVRGCRLTIECNDITKVQGVQAIVNAANPRCLGGGGIDAVIHRAAGPELLAACQALPEVEPGIRCRTGDAVITVSGNLPPPIERVIHAVGPVYNPRDPRLSRDLLRRTYQRCLEVAHENGVQTIAIPAISTGIFDYPFREATEISLEIVKDYLNGHPGHFTEVKLIHFTHDRTVEAGRMLTEGN